MTTFLIVAALLTAAALLFVLPTLLRGASGEAPHASRDQVNLTVLRDQLRELDADLAAGTISGVSYDGARQELELRVAEDVQPGQPLPAVAPRQGRIALALALTLPALAAALYLYLGTSAGLEPTQRGVSAQQQEQGHAVTDEQIAAMVQSLSERLKQQPDDAEGWNMLARSYSAMNRFGEAAQAYAKLEKLLPDNADVLADYADTLAMAQNKTLLGEPEKLIERALKADPKHIKALALSGSGAFERADYARAVLQWQQILPLVQADSDIARSTAGSIAQARELMANPAGAAATPAAAAPGTTSGSVELDPALRALVADTDTVFIFARAVQGPRFPLAVLRKQVKDLPLRFALDDTMSMVPEAKLSAFPQVIVGARISKSGSANAQSGDFEGTTETVSSGAQGLKIVINAQRK
ncbi:MAG: c-type cytochrome biogenesis protein CcmI [Telluria sp.]|nr:c-type cytochrome biogenesis protein CcmI [Telluria sp.]